MVNLFLTSIVGGVIGAYSMSGSRGSYIDMGGPVGFFMGSFAGVVLGSVWNFGWYWMGYSPAINFSLTPN